MLQSVEVPQAAALKACLTQPRNTTMKITAAIKKCFDGDDDSRFDWEDFARINKVSVKLSLLAGAQLLPGSGPGQQRGDSEDGECRDLLLHGDGLAWSEREPKVWRGHFGLQNSHWNC